MANLAFPKVMSDYLISSGATAMRDQFTAEAFGVAGGSGIAEGYVILGLMKEPEGNASIHEVDFEEPFAEGLPRGRCIAVDLMGSLATRERSSWPSVIEQLRHF